MNTTTVRPQAAVAGLAERAGLLEIPVTTAASPDGEAARLHTIQWLRRFGVFGRETEIAEYDAQRLDRLSALFYPGATGSELALANDLNGWFFVFDDQFDGELGCRPEAVARLVDSVIRITEEPAAGSGLHDTASSTPLLDSFRDLWRRINAGMPQLWRQRFRRHWCGYLSAHTREAQERAGRPVESLDALLAVKRHSVGVQPCLDLHERFGGQVLPQAVHQGYPLTLMRQATDDVVIFINDIVSLDKELAAGEVHNSVILRRERHGGTLDAAVRHIAALANARFRFFEELAAQLPVMLARDGAPAELRSQAAAYVDGMRHVMAGSLAWSLSTSRYDERGVAAVSSGRQRPWADLTPLGDLDSAADGGARAAGGIA